MESRRTSFGWPPFRARRVRRAQASPPMLPMVDEKDPTGRGARLRRGATGEGEVSELRGRRSTVRNCQLYQGKPARRCRSVPAVRRQAGPRAGLVQRLRQEGRDALAASTGRHAMTPAFPFSAIVGQERDEAARSCSRRSSRELGGVLVFGDRGTGKSTAVRGARRAAAEAARRRRLSVRLRSGRRRRATCASASPVRTRSGQGAADRAGHRRRSSTCRSARPRTGSSARSTSNARCRRASRRSSPGLLARANRGFLYVDEVNLLEDHLVDLLIDVAASGENVVEREGLSVRHPARFVLVGSGNPEEGELRPQLLDRFGLSVEVTTPRDLPRTHRGGPAPRRVRARPRGLHRALAEGRRAHCVGASSRRAHAARRGRGRRRGARARRRGCACSSAPMACAAN